MEAYTNPNLTTWRDDYKMPFPKNSFLESCSAGWSYIFVPALLCLWSWWHEGCSSSTFSQRTRTLMCLSCLLPIDPVIITHGETFIIYQRYLDYLQLCIRIHQDKFMITQISITLLIHPTYIGQDIPMKISKNLTMWAWPSLSWRRMPPLRPHMLDHWELLPWLAGQPVLSSSLWLSQQALQAQIYIGPARPRCQEDSRKNLFR